MTAKTDRRYYPWTCWTLAALAYFIQYGLMVFPSAIPELLRSSLSISSVQLGLFSAAFLYPFVLLQIPAGLLFDHFGSRNLLFYSTLLMALGAVLMGISHEYAVALIGRVLMGIGGSFSFVGAVYLARSWFSVWMFPIIVGLTEALSGIGEIGLPAIFVALKNVQSWRMISLEIGLVTLTLAFLIYLHVRDKQSVSVKHHVNIRKDLWRTLSNKNLWILGLFAGFAYTHFMVLTDMWGVLFLQNRFHLSLVAAIFENSLVIIGYTIGCVCVGYTTRYISRRRLIFICTFIELACQTSLTFYELNLASESVALFMVGLATSVVVLSYDIAEKMVPANAYGVAAGFITMFFGLIAMLVVPIVGYLSANLQLQIYLASFPVVICSAIALLLALRINLSPEFAFADVSSKL